jgi:hypothetical protein
VCEHHPEGVYCETYLKELKFGYIMYNDILNLVDGDKKYDKKIDEIFDKNWDSIFLKNKENE